MCCFCICKPKGIQCWLCIAENAAGLEGGTAWRLQGMEAVSSAWCFQACKSERAVAHLIMNADLWHYAGIFRDWGLDVWKDVNRDAFEDCHMLPSCSPHSIFFSCLLVLFMCITHPFPGKKGKRTRAVRLGRVMFSFPFRCSSPFGCCVVEGGSWKTWP